MKTYTHGGDIYQLKNTDKKIYDFSANINPLGIPNSIVNAAAYSIKNCFNYPDPLCRELTLKIGKYENVNPDYIVCGNGAADLIYRIAMALKPKKGLVNAPTFSEYEDALKAMNCQVVHNYLKEANGFKLTSGILQKIDDEKPDIVFICNPNNPVGNLVDKELLIEILKKDITVVVDECFVEFTGMAEDITLKPVLEEYKNLIILKAFTKNFAMAGLRLGYIMSSDMEKLDKIFQSGQPWSVSTPAQAGGIVALDEKAYLFDAVKMIKSEKVKLCDGLKSNGMEVYPPAANYIFFKCKDGKRFCEEMKKYNVLVRNCGNYPGLTDDYLRIAVRTPEENQYFLQVMKEVTNG